MKSKCYDAIDFAKLIAALFVVAIHADPLIEINELANTLISQGVARLAVPLFFMVSAFFLFQTELTKDRLVRYCKRILTLYACWFLISLPITIYSRIIQSSYSIPIALLLMIKNFFLTSTFSGSWYLMSSIFCAGLFYYLKKLPEKNRKIAVIALSIVAYMLCVLCSAYGKLLAAAGVEETYQKITLILAKPYTSIIAGIPYFACGSYFAEKREQSVRIAPVWTILFGILLLAEIYLVQRLQLANSTDCYWMLLPCAVCLFDNLLCADVTIHCAKELRYCSTTIYFAHFIWLFVLEFAEYILNCHISNLAKYGLAVVLSLATAFCIKKLEHCRPFAWLENLY